MFAEVQVPCMQTALVIAMNSLLEVQDDHLHLVIGAEFPPV